MDGDNTVNNAKGCVSMLSVSIGEIIKSRRKDLDCSQEDLSFGICSVSTLSKIERGLQIPTRATFEALMERLGVSPHLYPSFSNEKDRASFELQHEFNEAYAKSDYAEAERVLNELDGMSDLDRAHESFILTSRLLLKQRKRLLEPKDAIKEFEQIIKLYIRNFSIGKIKKYLLTKNDINLLNALAVAYYESGDSQTAIKILYELAEFIRNKVTDREGFSIIYTKILYNLSSYVGMSNNHEEVLRICTIAIEDCVKYSRYRYFSHLIFNKGCSLINLGRETEGHECIKASYYICAVIGKHCEPNLKFIKDYAIKLGIGDMLNEPISGENIFEKFSSNY